MSRWFRMYDDLLDDPKVQRLDPVLFKTWVNLLCLASRNEGVLPPVDDVAFALRIDTDTLWSRMVELIDKGLIDENADGGTLFPHNWNKRQFLSDNSTERSRKHRGAKTATAVQQECNVASTVAATPPDTDTDTDTETTHHARGSDDWATLEAQCRQAAGWEREPSPNLFVIGPIAALLDAGCILELDVLPTIKARSPSCRGSKSWKYFISAIQQARDDRLGALTPANPSKPSEARHGTSPKHNTIANSFAVVDAAIADERNRIAALERELAGAGVGATLGGESLELVS
jgi:hypothetical protein